jgi:hypothetical protein
MPLFGWESVSRDDPSYKTCLAASTGSGVVIGAMTGRSAGLQGVLAGAAGGLLWGFGLGYLACPYLVPAVKRKIENGLSLNDAEIRSAADAMSRYASVGQASEALKLVGLVKSTVPVSYSGAVCRDPAQTARRLLARA